MENQKSSLTLSIENLEKAAIISKQEEGHKSVPKEYESVKNFADNSNYKYPLDTEAHVRAAISYFGMPRNYGEYKESERKTVATKIKNAARKYGIEISDEWLEKFGVKEMKKAFIKICDNLYIDLSKAKGTHKYIKRLPHPNPKSGRKWIYFYSQKQVKDFEEKGIIPKNKEERKERSGILGAWSALADFFGITGGRNSDETAFRKRIQDKYSIHKDKIPGVDVSKFAYYMNEYLSNKDKWDAKLSAAPKEKGEKKETSPKTEKPKNEKTSSGKSEKSWDMNLMRKIAGIVGSEKKEKSTYEKNSEKIEKERENIRKKNEERIKEIQNQRKELLESDPSFKDLKDKYKLSKDELEKYRDFAKDHLLIELDEKIKNDSDLKGDEAEDMAEKIFFTRHLDIPENFDTMPEGELTEKENLTLENIKRADVSYREGRNDTFARKEEYEKWHTPEGLKKLHNEVKKDLPNLYPFIDKNHLEKTGNIKLTEEGKRKFSGDKNSVMSQEDTEFKNVKDFLSKVSKEEFNKYPRFHQQLIASRFGIKPEERVRNKETEKLVNKQTGKSLQMAPDKAPDKFWSDSRDLYEEIKRGDKKEKSSQPEEGGGEIEKEGLENLSSAKKYIENIMEGYKEQAKKAEAQGISKEKIDSALSAREKDAINYVKKLQSWIDDKDYNKLKEILHSGNKMSKKMFEEYTGINLGNTQSITNSAIEKFVGEEKVNAEKVKKEKAEKEKEIKEREEKEARDKEKYGHLGDFGENLTPKQKGAASKFLKEPVRWGNEGVSTRQEKIDKLINDGWEIKSSKYSGKRFQSRDGSFYDEFDKKTAMDYIEHKLKKLGKFKETEEIKYNQEYSTLRDKKDSLEKQIDKMYQGWGTSDSVREKIREKRKEIEEIKEKLKNMDSNPPEPMQKASQLAIGTKVESEHDATIKFIAKYLKEHNKLPSNEEIHRSIAKDHLAEIPDYYTRLNKMEKEADSELKKSTDILTDTLEKGKAMPVGTVSKGKKKVAEGKWVPVKKDGEKKQSEEEKKNDKKKQEQESKGSLSDQQKGTMRSALKKFASILADALSGRDVNQPTGTAVEETGTMLQEKSKKLKQEKENKKNNQNK